MRDTRNPTREKQNFHTNKVQSEQLWCPHVTRITAKDQILTESVTYCDKADMSRGVTGVSDVT